MGYAYDESPFVPFNTPQVGPTVPILPSPDMRDAEIAKLRSDLAAARDAVFREGLARIEAEKEIASLTAALKAEREACDEAEDHLRQCFVHHLNGDENENAVRAWRNARSARRAAEAKGETK